MRLTFVPLLLALAAGCGEATSAPAVQAESAELERPGPGPNPMLFAKDERPYGRSLERWSELLWSWIYAQPPDHVPLLDPTGADCDVGQHGPMWFLAAVPGSSLGTDVVRTCTVPRHKAMLLQLASTLNDWPCPDPTFRPAPGQSLYDFLIAPIKPLFDGETGFAITLDGVAIQDPLQYRATSDDLFFFKGNPALTAEFDTCVTGHWQPAVIDGYYVPFRPMSPGEHTIVIDGHDMHGVPVRLTWKLTVR